MKHRIGLQFPAAQREMRMLPANFKSIDAFNAVGPHQVLPVFIVFLVAAVYLLTRPREDAIEVEAALAA